MKSKNETRLNRNDLEFETLNFASMVVLSYEAWMQPCPRDSLQDVGRFGLHVFGPAVIFPFCLFSRSRSSISSSCSSCSQVKVPAAAMVVVCSTPSFGQSVGWLADWLVDGLVVVVVVVVAVVGCCGSVCGCGGGGCCCFCCCSSSSNSSSCCCNTIRLAVSQVLHFQLANSRLDILRHVAPCPVDPWDKIEDCLLTAIFPVMPVMAESYLSICHPVSRLRPSEEYATYARNLLEEAMLSGMRILENQRQYQTPATFFSQDHV